MGFVTADGGDGGALGELIETFALERRHPGCVARFSSNSSCRLKFFR
jgi:hypothetical protein